MKSILSKISIGICGMAAVLSASCVGDLDLAPNDPHYINGGSLTVQDYQGVLNKCYGGMAYSGQGGPNGNCDISGLDGGTSQYTRVLFMMNEFPTDEAIWIHPDLGVIDLVTNTWGKDNANIFGTYSRLYSHIAVCNDFIRMARDNSDPAVRLMVLEARALRAMSYYWVIDIFGRGSYTLDTDPMFASPEQKDRRFLYEWLDGELTDIETLFEEEFPTNQVQYGRIGIDGVMALHARLSLNAGVYTDGAVNGYKQCSSLCERIIERHLGGGFDGSGLAVNYMYLFCADNDEYMPGGANKAENEILWGIPYDSQYTQAYGGTQFLIAAATANETNGFQMSSADYGINNPWKCMHASKQFSEKFAPEDIRWSMWGKENAGFSISNDKMGDFDKGYAVIKFTNLLKGVNGKWSEANGGTYAPAGTPPRAETWVDTDQPLIRLADVYLMYAECNIMAGAGDASKALTYVNYVRRRAGVTPWTAMEMTSDNILSERCRELYWELTRRSDLIRFGKFSENYNWMWKGNMRDGQNFGSYMNVMPIPTNIIAAQPTFVQNPGY